MEEDVERDASTGSPQARSATGNKKVSPPKVSEKESRKDAEKTKRQREKHEAEVAARIESIEKRTLAIDAELCREEIFSDPAALRRLTEERATLNEELEALYDQLMKLEAEVA